MQTQWRHAPSGRATGLDYTAVESAARMLGVADPRDTFERLRVMEGAALEVGRAGG